MLPNSILVRSEGEDGLVAPTPRRMYEGGIADGRKQGLIGGIIGTGVVVGVMGSVLWVLKHFK